MEGSNYPQIGGAACYCGITAREFKFDVELFTKFGKDFPQQYLTDNKIKFENAESEKPTTRFAINITGADRTLKLENECEPITYEGTDADGCLVSPIYHEITQDVFSSIKKDSSFTMVDPQQSGTDIPCSYINSNSPGRDWFLCVSRKTQDDQVQTIWPALSLQEVWLKNSGVNYKASIFIGLREFQYITSGLYGINVYSR